MLGVRRGLGTQSLPPAVGVNSGEGKRGLVTKQRRYASSLLWLVVLTWGVGVGD